MTFRPLDYNEDLGIREDVQINDDGSFVIRTSQKTSKIIENNKALQNEGLNTTKDLSFHHIASIPLSVVLQWMEEDGVDLMKLPKGAFGQYVKRKLNDPDNWYLKTTGARRI